MALYIVKKIKHAYIEQNCYINNTHKFVCFENKENDKQIE